jgi:peroxin-6
MIAQFLTEMDYCMTAGNIYIIGATNRPDLLDTAILQPGRFDVMIYLGINNDAPTRISILKAKAKKMKVSACLEEVEKFMPQNFTGADIFSFVAKAYRNSLVRVKSMLQEKVESSLRNDQKSVRDWRRAVDEIADAEKEVVVTEDDFREALKTVKQSVSEKDLAMYQRFK